MHIRKQRLLTPGPTPLYPPALHAMMASDIHHRTEDFRKVYRSCLADLKEVMGTTNDVLMFCASGTGAMDASVSNLFSRGDKVIVCVGRKVRRALGGDRQGLRPGRHRADGALRRGGHPGAGRNGAGGGTRDQGRFRAGFGNLHRRGARRARHGRRRDEDRCHLRGGRHHRPRHHAARYRRLGPRRGDRRIAEGLHDSAGPGVPVGQPEGLEVRRDRHAAALLLQSEEGKEERRRRRIELDAVHVADSGAGRSAEIRQADRHGEADRERADAGPGHARRRGEAGARAVLGRVAGLVGHRRESARRAWIPASS